MRWIGTLVLAAACSSHAPASPDASSPDADPAHPACLAGATPARRLVYWTAPPGTTATSSLVAVNLADGQAPCVVALRGVKVGDQLLPLAIAPAGFGVLDDDAGDQTTILDLRGATPALGASANVSGDPIERYDWATTDYDTDFDGITSLFSPDGSVVVEETATAVAAIHVDAAGALGPVQTLLQDQPALVWAPSGARLLEIDDAATSTQGGQLVVQDVAAGTSATWTLPANRNATVSSMWSPDGRFVAVSMIAASGDDPDLVVLADTMHPERGLLDTIASPADDVELLDWSPDGTRVAVATSGTVHVFSAGDAAPADLFQAPTIGGVVRLTDDTHVLVPAEPASLVLADASGATLTLASNVVDDWRLSPDRQTLEVTSSLPSLIPVTGAAPTTPGCIGGDDGNDGAGAFTADGARFACVDTMTTLVHVETIAGGATQAIDLAPAGATSPAGVYTYASWSPDGGALFVARGTQAFVIDAMTMTAAAVPAAYERAVEWQVL